MRISVSSDVFARFKAVPFFQKSSELVKESEEVLATDIPLPFHHRVLARVVFVIVMVFGVGVVQSAYFKDMTLPFLSIDGEKQQIMPTQVAADIIKKSYEFETKSIVMGKTTKQVPAIAMGYKVDEKKLAKDLESPFWAKVIPGASIIYGKGKNIHVDMKIDASTQDEFIQKFIAVYNQEPVNAQFEISNNIVIIIDDIPGYILSADELKAAMTDPNKDQIVIAAQEKPAVITAEMLQEQLDHITSKVRALTITVDGKEFIIPKDVVGSWISISDSSTGQQLVFSEEKIAYYVDTVLYNETYEPAGTSNSTLLNGSEVSRTEGSQGYYIPKELAVQTIQTTLTSGVSDSVLLKRLALVPKLVVSRTYSNDTAGRTAKLLQDMQSEYPNYGVEFYNLTDSSKNFSYQSGKSFYMASLFKVYEAHMIINRIEAGSASWDTVLSSGQTIDTCFSRMLVISEDACAHYIIDYLGGYAAVHNWVRAQGFSSTTYVPTLSTTPHDIAYFFARLHDGTLMTEVNKNKLISTLDTQVYRQGIPKGISGSLVADKVGIYGGYLHDAGLVRINGNTYIVAILSSGGTWNGIASIASQLAGL